MEEESQVQSAIRVQLKTKDKGEESEKWCLRVVREERKFEGKK